MWLWKHKGIHSSTLVRVVWRDSREVRLRDVSGRLSGGEHMGDKFLKGEYDLARPWVKGGERERERMLLV